MKMEMKGKELDAAIHDVCLWRLCLPIGGADETANKFEILTVFRAKDLLYFWKDKGLPENAEVRDHDDHLSRVTKRMFLKSVSGLHCLTSPSHGRLPVMGSVE